ncbi:MAG: helix-turn-helix transcriptional regulator [Desulfuromonadaceae bacterium]|nr:helix-turn-helix transcriptional regulator [Desulfuromonadaceae bacterium]
MDKHKEIKLDFSSVSQWKMDVYQTIADLTIYRLRHDITQTELAGRMGVSQSVVARFERAGRMPTFEFIYKIAKGLGVDLKPLRFEPVNQISDCEEDVLNFPDAVFAKWEQNVYQIVSDLTVYRLKQRISQAELAQRINTSQSVITRFERLGRIPTLEFIYRVADGLGVRLLPFTIVQSESHRDGILDR